MTPTLPINHILINIEKITGKEDTEPLQVKTLIIKEKKPIGNEVEYKKKVTEKIDREIKRLKVINKRSIFLDR